MRTNSPITLRIVAHPAHFGLLTGIVAHSSSLLTSIAQAIQEQPIKKRPISRANGCLQEQLIREWNRTRDNWLEASGFTSKLITQICIILLMSGR